MGDQKSDVKKSKVQEWVNLYGDELYRWALYKTGEREAAEDLVQETFFAAFKSVEKYLEKSKPKTWLFSILNNKVIDYHRKKFKSTFVTWIEDLSDEFFDINDSWKNDMEPNNWNELEENLLDNHEFNEIFNTCMQNLPTPWFSAIQYKYLDQKDAKIICQELGITSSNYWKILQRAKLQLRKCIEINWFNK